MQNDRTDIGKAVLTPGTIGFKLKPNPRKKSDYPFLNPVLAQIGAFSSCNRCIFVNVGPSDQGVDTVSTSLF